MNNPGSDLIALDAMGGDNAPRATVAGAVAARGNHGVDVILVDNFDDQALVKAVARVDGRALVEASGGVTLARVATISAAGVDVMSIGALTHSAPAVDLGLDWT